MYRQVKCSRCGKTTQILDDHSTKQIVCDCCLRMLTVSPGSSIADITDFGAPLDSTSASPSLLGRIIDYHRQVCVWVLSHILGTMPLPVNVCHGLPRSGVVRYSQQLGAWAFAIVLVALLRWHVLNQERRAFIVDEWRFQRNNASIARLHTAFERANWCDCPPDAPSGITLGDRLSSRLDEIFRAIAPGEPVPNELEALASEVEARFRGDVSCGAVEWLWSRLPLLGARSKAAADRYRGVLVKEVLHQMSCPLSPNDLELLGPPNRRLAKCGEPFHPTDSVGLDAIKQKQARLKTLRK